MVEVVNSPDKFEREPCGRCGGDGRYGPTSVYGGKCFDCHGKGVRLTRRGRAAAEFLRNLRKCRADEVKVGDLIRVGGMTMGCQPFEYFARVVEVVTPSRCCGGGTSQVGDVFTVVTPADLRDITTEHEKLGRSTKVCGHGSPVERGWGAEEKAANLRKALDYQATLTKTGTPRKVPVAG